VSSLALLLLGPVAGLAADAAGTVSLSDRSEATWRSTPPGSSPNAVDLSTTPQAGFHLAWPDFDVGLGYAITISDIDVNNHDPNLNNPVIINAAQVALGWSQPDLRITFTVAGTYGHKNYLNLAPNPNFDAPMTTTGAGTTGTGTTGTGTTGTGTAQPPPPPPNQATMPQFVPATQKILQVGSLRATLAVANRFSMRWTGNAAAYYEISGGIREEDQVDKFYVDPVTHQLQPQSLLPQVQGPGLTLGLTYALDPADDLATSVSASDMRISQKYEAVPTAGAEYRTLVVTEVYRHTWSQQTSGALGLGVTAQYYRQSFRYSYGTSVLPNANANITHAVPLEAGSKLNLSASTGVGTGYNQATGEILYLATAGGSVGWTYEHFGATASLTGGQSLRGGDDTKILAGSLTLSYTPVELVDVYVGARESWAIVPGAVSSNSPIYGFFAGLVIRAPPIKF